MMSAQAAAALRPILPVGVVWPFAPATSEESGWAAATAVSRWVFKAPRRDGKPVDVRVGIPSDSKPPTT